MKQVIKLVVFVVLSLFIFNSSVVAQETGSGGIGGRPANPRDDNPRSKSIFVHTIEPGGSVSDGVKVINNSEQKRSVIVYATDSINSSGGAFACKQKVEPSNGVGSWIKLQKTRVTLEPVNFEVIPFTITVPDGSDVGEHNGCIVIQEEKPNADVEEGIGLNFRTALRTAILVPGDTVKQLDITGFTHSFNDSNVILTPSVNNSGNVSVDSDIFTTISYPFGIELSSAGGQYPILRDQTSEWNFEHQKPFWGGFVKSGLTVSFNDNPDNFIGDSNENTTTITDNGSWIFIVPNPVAIFIYLAALALIITAIYLIIKSRKKQRAIKQNWKTYKITKGDDIKSVAKEHAISWKKLARANKLSAPYSLEPGKSIKVPSQNKE